MIFVLIALAVARVTRMVTADVLFDRPRKWAIRKLIAYPDSDGVRGLTRSSGFRYEISYLIVCDWCASVYVGAVAAGAWYAWGETMAFTAVCTALAASYAAGYLNTRAGD